MYFWLIQALTMVYKSHDCNGTLLDCERMFAANWQTCKFPRNYLPKVAHRVLQNDTKYGSFQPHESRKYRC